ncbi:hypothetical protein [Sphingomonas sanxanigenens]|uniref:Uncharacterized protein n=1 Tax=Sphingomonas sanxanigenens DSM 19645 = NX02 TaxID=1123269 RepID=W0AJT8_9SPHN|nr:hypothetical protein [Sphingomonas sanxanigenens]AHE57406.1 hypothetical protein NX02_29190 [Sphingomonas sanxanigenens DSM 19645 = NX02]
MTERHEQPDLTQAPPISDVLAGCETHLTRNDPDTYAYCILQAAKASGITVDLFIDDAGPAAWYGIPFDGQEHHRKPRLDAIIEHMRGAPQRGEALVNYMLSRGMFLDRRRFGSPSEAADAVLALDGRLFIINDGDVEMSVLTDAATLGREIDDGFPRRSLVHRWTNSMRLALFAEEMKAWLILNGADLGGGRYSLETKALAR